MFRIRAGHLEPHRAGEPEVDLLEFPSVLDQLYEYSDTTSFFEGPISVSWYRRLCPSQQKLEGHHLLRAKKAPSTTAVALPTSS